MISFQMAKVITQDTFDSVVRENMEEFEMDVDEAIADAVTQFESQVSYLFPNVAAGQLLKIIPWSRSCREGDTRRTSC